MSQGNVAVVTGAAQGIGRATATELDRRGWSLVLLDLQHVDATGYRDALAVAGDITDPSFLTEAHRAAMSRFGGVTALVNNAGRSMIAPATDTTADELRAVLEVNLVAPFALSTLFGATMLDRGRGAIVNVASTTRASTASSA